MFCQTESYFDNLKANGKDKIFLSMYLYKKPERFISIYDTDTRQLIWGQPV